MSVVYSFTVIDPLSILTKLAFEVSRNDTGMRVLVDKRALMINNKENCSTILLSLTPVPLVYVADEQWSAVAASFGSSPCFRKHLRIEPNHFTPLRSFFVLWFLQ